MRKVERKGLWLLVALVGAIGCSNGDGNGRETSANSVVSPPLDDAHQRLVDARAFARLPIASDPRVTWDRQAKGVVPGFGAEKRRLVDITLPSSAHETFAIREAASGLEARFRLEGAAPRAVALTSGVAVYPGAGPSGSDVMVTVSPHGIEDFVLFHTPPASPTLRYSLDVPKGTGLRLVSGVLEMVDAKGAPRLRVEPPYVANREGRAKATLAIEGCAVDTSPRAPWGRPVSDPGNSTCTVVVDFSKAGLSYPLVVDPAWSATQNGISSARSHLTGTSFVLDTDVSDTTPPITLFLAAGGYDLNGDASASAELYEPVTRTFAVTGNLGTPRGEHAATLLPGTLGQVLVTGGRTKSGSGNPLTSIELYDELTGTFASKGNLSTSRYAHTATLFKSGALDKVLIAAGTTTLGQNTKNGEVYDVATGTLTSTNAMNTARAHHTAVFLDPAYVNTSGLTGKVLVVGGTIFGNALFAAELYDPTTNAFQITVPNINLSATRSRAYHTATLLGDGTVFVAGGRTADTSGTLHDGEYFGSTGFPGTLVELTDLRAEHTASFLPNGDLVLAGGNDGTSSVATTTVLTPSTGAVAAGPALATARASHAGGEALQGQSFSSGEGVLVVGGVGVAGVLASAEVLGRANGDLCTLDEECQSNFCVTEPIDPNDPNSATESRCCNSDCKELCKTCRDVDPNLHGTCDFYQQAVSLGWQCKTTTDLSGAGGGGGAGGSGEVPDYVEFQLQCLPGGVIAPTEVSVCNPNDCDPSTDRCRTTCPCPSQSYCDDGGSPDVAKDVLGCDKNEPALVNAGVCITKLPQGAECSWCYQCETGQCVDGFCCENDCDRDSSDAEKLSNQCRACNGKTPGRCEAIEAPAPVNSDVGQRPICVAVDDSCRGTCGGVLDKCTSLEGLENCRPQRCDYTEKPMSDGTARKADSQFVVPTCDAAGACVDKPTTCDGFACIESFNDQGVALATCVDSCTSQADCDLGFACENNACVAMNGPRCWLGVDDSDTVAYRTADPEGNITDCSPYICANGGCLKACASVDDCLSPTVCSPEGKCVSRVENPEVDASSCAVQAPGHTPGEGDNDALWLALVAASAVFARRRR